VGVPFIARQTDRGVPSYDDRAGWHANQDRFVFNGGQELVPVCVVGAGLTCAGKLAEEQLPAWSTGHQYFRPRVEGSFLRFFWAPDHLTWRVQDKSGVTMELGVPLDGTGRRDGLEVNAAAPSNRAEIYRWHLVRQYDAYGEANPSSGNPAPVNVVVYKYLQEGGQAYLSDIYATPPAANAAASPLSSYAQHTRLVYEPRTDPTESYRSGWLMRQTLRLARVDVASKPFAGGVSAARRLVRRYHLTYDPSYHTSLLTSVQVEGRCAGAEESAPAESGEAVEALTGCEKLPPMTFEYSHVKGYNVDGDAVGATLAGYEAFDERVRDVSSSPPHSIDEALTDYFDINADGLPDVLVTAPGLYGNDHAVFFNSEGGKKDAFGGDIALGVAGVLGANSGTIKLSNDNVAPLDLDGDGIVDLLHMPKVKTYSIYTPELRAGKWTWAGRAVETASQQNPKIDFGQDTLETRLVDVNFDGLVDVVVSTGKQFQTFLSLGRLPGGDGQFGHGSFASATSATISNDPIAQCVPFSGTPVRFSDSDIQLADMNGDGISDIVRLRRGDIRYWPGRGNGFWGTGDRDDCPADTFGDKRYVSMDGAPYYSDIQGTSLRIDDVNGDGLDDLVQVRFDAIDVYLNVDGKGWTKRHIIDGTPASPSYANRVRLTDLNGSGTRDIVWGNAKKYQYIDTTGGVRPQILTRVTNGLGKSTAIEYSTSTAEMLAAEATGGSCDPDGKPWSSPWCTRMPTITHVVKRVIESDNLSVAGSGPGTYITEYSYRDPVYEGRQREFRGFRKARSKRVGDANSPSDFTESTFLLGECEDETPGAISDCAVSERWRDNPREALKGLPVITERYDEQGVYLSTEATTYRLRHLYTGLDGRAVRHAFESRKEVTSYDTAAGTSSLTTALRELVELETAPSALPADLTTVQCSALPAETLAPPLDPALSKTRLAVPLRAGAGTATIASRSYVDALGNKLIGVAEGCIGGDACPTPDAATLPSITADEKICSFTEPLRITSNPSQWLYRTGRAWTQGSVDNVRRGKTTTSYDAFGAPTATTAELTGTVPLLRSHALTGRTWAPTPSDAVSDNPALPLGTRAYDSFGNLIKETGPNHRCRTIDYEASLGASGYQQFPTVETVYTFGCPETPGPAPTRPLTTVALYDRGLGLVTSVLDMSEQQSLVSYDPFGRLTELRRPRPDGVIVSAAQTPSVKISYDLPPPGSARAYSIIHTQTQDGASVDAASYLESYAYIDGMGRSRVTLTEADPDPAHDGFPWIVSEVAEFDAKGAVRRKYIPFYTSADPNAFPLTQAPTAQYGRQRYDAFGRQIQTFDVDGTVTLQSRYHALSTDLYDAADLYPGPHQGSYASTRTDGHGRTIATTERIHVNGALESREVRTRYLATGQPLVITRVRLGSSDKVTRWMRYDSLGRMVLNVDPHATVSFNADPAAAANGMKTWRYVYNAAGDLVGTSDARGCGQNFHYDGAGRLIAEDYSPCEKIHALYVTPNLTTGTGFEVYYEYDNTPSTIVTPPSGYASTSSTLRGRLKAVHDRAASTWFKYDARGRTETTYRKVSYIGAPVTSIAVRYADRWYQKDFQYDAADRPVEETTGATSTELLASDGQSRVQTGYTKRGTLKHVDSSYGMLVKNIKRSADGLVQSLLFDDAAATQTAMQYDTRRRLRSVQTFRSEANLWSTAPPSITPVPGTTDATRQLLLQDLDYSYDVVNNPTEIRDWRTPEEWPEGAKPSTRRMQYDDLYRVTRVDYQYPGGTDKFTSPYAYELNGGSDARRPTPYGHQLPPKRTLWQSYKYDWLGNTTNTDDDRHVGFDRSLGSITNNTASSKPYQLGTTSQAPTGGKYNGSVTATSYDTAGNLVYMRVARGGPTCTTTLSVCLSRFFYEWDEVGRVQQARRVEGEGSNSSGPWLDYLYDANDQRVVKQSRQSYPQPGGGAASGPTVTTLYIFDSLELRRAARDPVTNQYPVNASTEVAYLSANGMRLARLHYEVLAKGEPRLETSGALHAANLHVFLNLPDHLGSSSLIVDKATGELVEARTYQPFGATESDYRPERWKGFREDYGFTGKEEDIEVGLQYFGKRFYSPYLGRWISPDPLAVHEPGEADLNLYAYVRGAVLMLIDPVGLAESAPIGVNVTPEQQKAMGVGEGDYFFMDPKGSGTQRFTDLDAIRAEAAKRGLPVFQVNSTSTRTIKEAKDFAEMMASLRGLAESLNGGGDGPGGSCTGPACGTAKPGQEKVSGETDAVDVAAHVAGVLDNELAKEGGKKDGSPGGQCDSCPGSKTQQAAVAGARVATTVGPQNIAKGAKAAARALKKLGLDGVRLAGRSFNSGRKALAKAGFKLTRVTKTGRKEFTNAKTGAQVFYDSGEALAAGQKPHWHIVDAAGNRYNRTGRVVDSDDVAGHIPAD
jgi:RHS repeat-associated protein